jgi:alpha-mannosidase
VRDGVLRLSLLRSPTIPDPEADQGEHRFVYSLLPHSGGWGETTIAEAYGLNDPLIVVAARGGEPIGERFARGESLVFLDRPNAVIETVKGAEDGRGFIVRLYESQRRRGGVTLTAGVSLAGAWRTNLLEEDQSELEVKVDSVVIPLKPYEIATVRLVPAT